ncbi:histidine kinase dimerization/phospho-acceptor domain-containing protein [Saccharibacillus sp. CPCC 101409]|uniref:histidine kinase dimerization/phospho-acceptor domain-containing protein n=1 Tax=Saccharibacillus sp. CPCC 101409 TaxID=3058041 RepID=UPI0026723401|nr:histidine kinase dimerization/phospho-acceptor domain-containing protein [Saccharibacillus sp. CPCC 101409]MDO3412550.1 histidine kinase dimerization/phospho-acceptor domain-containing protein [Saccharibacillus sp. CPCC 101409]
MKNNKYEQNADGQAKKTRNPKRQNVPTGWAKGPGIDIRPIRWLLLAVIALGVVSFYPAILDRASVVFREEASPAPLSENRQEALINIVAKANYALPITQLKNSGDVPKPAEIYLSGLSPRNNSTAEERKNLNDFKLGVNQTVAGWQSEFADYAKNASSLEYMVYDDKQLAYSTNGSGELQSLVFREERGMAEKYAFYAVISYDANGTMSIPKWFGMDSNRKDRLLLDSGNRAAFLESISEAEPKLAGSSVLTDYIEQIRQPRGFTMVYALPRDLASTAYAAYAMKVDKAKAFDRGGFLGISLFAAGAAALLALLPARPPARRRMAAETAEAADISTETGFMPAPALRRLLKTPPELWAIAWAAVILTHPTLSAWSYTITLAGGGTLAELLEFVGVWCVWLALLTFCFGFAAYLVGATRSGWGRTLLRGSLFVQLFLLVYRGVRKLGQWTAEFDFADRSSRALLKLFGVHGTVVLAIVLLARFIGYFALIPLAVYLILLFVWLQKYKNQAQRRFALLLGSLQSTARGDLDTELTEDVGMFNPLRKELGRVREGFKHAVDEEIKSQKMKSELVTNVSHDLKTPVTAIITYIDLLRQPGISEDERRAYIEVLSGKSQRLNRLIEDLFEYSRASSGNVALTPVNVDLGELLKQAHVELEERLGESGVQLRFVLPDSRILLPLDSEKTFRIFENLYLNIAKYAVPGSRAYIELEDRPADVAVTFKNVSREELNFKPEEITERFVRGDTSRHTEGSGLGLAIVKSLVEVQDGTFRIDLDGDLFKAVIIWPKTDR